VKTVTITQPAVLTSTVAGTNVLCNGGNGSATLTASGGTTVYSYLWSNGAVTNTISAIAGVYTGTVTDANGCSTSQSISIIEPAVLTSTVAGTNVLCNGGNGSATLTASGGTTAYSYLWSNGAVTNTISAIAGVYTGTVTDANLCTSVKTVTITQPTALSSISTLSSPLCHGVSTGSINVTISGGVVPYSYSWSNGASTQDLNSIAAGSYTLHYNDQNGCKDSMSVTLNQPDTIILVKRIDNLKCNGDTIGNVFLTPSGGTSPYTYLWSDGSTGKDLSNINSGVYSVILTDANGCVYMDTSKITQPDSLELNFYSPVLFNGYNVSTYNGNDGSINLTVTGGLSPYTFLWSNGSATQNLYNLPAGNYFVTVMDTNGCRISGSILLKEPFVLEMPQGYSPNDDGKNDLFVVHGIEAYPDNVLTIYNRWGTIVYSKTGYLNEWDGKSNNGTLLPDATYFAILEVNKGEIVLRGYVELRR
jgi:gliding motility-associated-like protein